MMVGAGEIVYKTVDLGVAGGRLAGRQAGRQVTELLHVWKSTAARVVHVLHAGFWFPAAE